MYDFNLLVSCPWGMYESARTEILSVLKTLGDEKPVVRRTTAQGIMGVKTSLDSRRVVQELRRLHAEDPLIFLNILKWLPVDLWTYSDMESMKEAVLRLRDKIHKSEKWRMTVEKRRYTRYHKIEVIKELAELIDEKVDLKEPDKILRVDIIGKYAGVSVLSPQEIFSATRLPTAKEGEKAEEFRLPSSSSSGRV